MIKMKTILSNLQKKYGTGTVNTYRGLGLQGKTIDRFSSGSLIINHMLGGGWPRGRIIEILGDESSGKTTLSLHAIAQVQKLGENVCFIDMEHSLDLDWAQKLGVNIDSMILATPNSGEEALDIAEAIVAADDCGLVVIDSVAALVPRAEIEGEIGDAHVGLQARLMGQALRKINPIASTHKTTVIFTNQIRQKIGVLYGSPETTSGGMALRFYSSIRMKVTRSTHITEGSETVGNKIKLYTMKNKTAPPFQKREIDLYYGRNGSTAGLSVDGELGQLMLDTGLIYKNAAFYTIPANIDFDRLVKEGALVPLSEVITQFPNVERQKVKGYDAVLKLLRQNLNLQKQAQETLTKGGLI